MHRGLFRLGHAVFRPARVVARRRLLGLRAPAAASLLFALPRQRHRLDDRVRFFFFLFIYAGGAYAHREKPASSRP